MNTGSFFVFHTPVTNVIKRFMAVSKDFHIELEHLSLASLSSLAYGLWVRPVAYLRVEHMTGASLGALALPANIRQGWKGLPETNALA